MALNLKSIFRINMVNLSPLFDAKKTEVKGKKESTEVYEAIATPSSAAPKRPAPASSKSETYQPVDYNDLLAYTQGEGGEGREITIKAPEITVAPKSSDSVVVKEVEKSLNIAGEDKQTALLSSLIDEQKKQTGLLELGLDPSDTFKSKEVAELRREAETKGHFSRLSQTIEDTQKESAEKISDSVEDMEEKLSDTISAMPVGGGGGGLLDDVIDGGGGGKKRGKRGGSRGRGRGKGSIFKRVLGKGKGVLSKVGTAATSLLPTAAPAALTTTLGTSVSGLAAGGAGGLATIGGAALGAGAVGYGVGTLLNKGISHLAGRDDWLFGWIGDKKEEKANKKRSEESYTKFEKISSPAVLKMMGGKEDFNAQKFIGLKMKGLIVWKDGRWYTKSESNLTQVEDINSTTKRAEQQTIAMPTHLIDTKPSGVSEEDKAKLDALVRKKESLLEEYNKDILGDVVKTGHEAQVKRFLSAYEKSEAALATAGKKQKADIKAQMKQSEAAIKELSGMQRVEVEELYKQKVAEKIDEEAKEILVPDVKEIEPMPLVASHVPKTEKQPKATESFKAGEYTVQGAQAGGPGRLQDIMMGLAEIKRLEKIESEKRIAAGGKEELEPGMTKEQIEEVIGKQDDIVARGRKRRALEQEAFEIKAKQKAAGRLPSIPLQASHTPASSGMERIATSDFKPVESKKDEVIEELRQERIDSLNADITEAKEKQKTTKGFFKRVGIRKEIRELEEKKSKAEEMTAQEYKGWLDDAIDDSKGRLKKLKKKRSSMFAFLSRGKIEEAIPRVEKEISMYEAEQARIEAITDRTAAQPTSPVIRSPWGRANVEAEEAKKAEEYNIKSGNISAEFQRSGSIPLPTAAIEQRPAEISTSLVNVVKEETRKAAETRNREGTSEAMPPQMIPLPQPQREPVPAVRTTKIDDAGVELLRTLISG